MSQPIHLRIPGPTPLPDAVREAGGRQMVNHRGPEFKELLARVKAALQRAFRTDHEVLILTCSGTGGLEAAVVNHLSPGDAVLSVSIGAFGDRFARIASRYGAELTKVEVTWGQAAQAAAVTEALGRMNANGRPARAVLLTHNETSTGVTNPLGELATAARAAAPHAVLLVDGISGLGAVPFETDGWDLDVVVTGSQKSWMAPPGLAMVSVSPRAWEAAMTASMPRVYFDLALHRDSAMKGETPWTPAVGVAFALDVALGMLEEEGYPRIFARHAACGAATRAGLDAMGIQLFADQAHASDTVTSAVVPDGVEWSALSKELRGRGLVLAGGQGALTGKIFRVGHLGAVTTDDILSALTILEDAFQQMGIAVTTGQALPAGREAVARLSAPLAEGEDVSRIAVAGPA